MKTSRLLLLVLKDYLKRPFMWVLLLAIPAMAIFLSSNSQKIDEHEIMVGYSIWNNEQNNDVILSEIPENDSMMNVIRGFDEYKGLFSFVYYEDTESLKTDVTLNRLECGYILSHDFIDNMTNGQRNELIEVLISNETTMDKVINETVFSIVFPIVSELSLEKYIVVNSELSSMYLDGTLDITHIKEIYDSYYKGGDTFRFAYEGQPEDYHISTVTILMSPLNGLIAIMILLTGLCGALTFFRDSANPVFKIFKVRLAYILMPSLMSFISGAISILCIASSLFANPAMQIGKLLVYTLVSVIFVLVISYIIKKETAFAAFIPIFLLGCLVFTPIFIDVAQFMPALKPISYIFLPYYYMAL